MPEQKNLPGMSLPVKTRTLKILESFGRIIFFDWFKNTKTGQEDSYMLFTIAQDMVPGMILPVTATGKVIVVKQFRQAAQERVLEIPGGCTKPGQTQTPEEVAVRELQEETGYRPGRMIPLGSLMLDPFFVRIRHHLFLGLNCEETSSPEIGKDEDPEMEVVQIPVKKWIQMCVNGEVEDSKSIVATMRALPHLRDFGVTLHY